MSFSRDSYPISLRDSNSSTNSYVASTPADSAKASSQFSVPLLVSSVIIVTSDWDYTDALVL